MGRVGFDCAHVYGVVIFLCVYMFGIVTMNTVVLPFNWVDTHRLTRAHTHAQSVGRSVRF